VVTRQPLVFGSTGGIQSYPLGWNNSGLFAETQINIREQVFVTGSVRAEDNANFGSTYNWPVSPRVGVTYVRPVGAATVKLRASYGRAIRAPYQGAKDSVDYGCNCVYKLASPELRPEQQIGPDGGVDIIFGSRASLSVTHYHQIAKDFIWGIYPPSADPNVFFVKLVNVARVKNTGWEFEGTLALGRIDLRGQFAITRSRPEDLGPIAPDANLRVGQSFVGIPDYTGGLTATATPFAHTSVTATLAYMGSWRNVDQDAYLKCAAGLGPCQTNWDDYYIDYPAYGKFGVAVEREFRRGLTAYVNVEDLTNSSFKRAEQNTYAMQGRISTVGIRFRP
jgi:outer membrane receptor protein involved in Fe transport